MAGWLAGAAAAPTVAICGDLLAYDLGSTPPLPGA
jgi:hypothetical protein